MSEYFNSSNLLEIPTQVKSKYDDDNASPSVKLQCDTMETTAEEALSQS